MTPRVKRTARRDVDRYAKWTGPVTFKSTFPAPGGSVEEHFLPLPVERTLEVRWDLTEDFDGDLFSLSDDFSGARVKPVVYVPESKADLLDREGLRKSILDAGAVYCKAPTVHVIRKRTKRDERHAVEVPLEDSLRIFAEEVRARDAERRVAFAAALARESDAGVTT